MLLVDDDQPEVARIGAKTAERGPTQTRASPRAAAPTRRSARPARELGVQDRDGVAEARDEARDDLRRQGDLGHEHDARRGRAASVAAAARR